MNGFRLNKLPLRACFLLWQFAVLAPLQTRAGEVHTTISAGVAAYSHQITAELLVKAADDALYQVKHSGRNRVCSFDPATALDD